MDHAAELNPPTPRFDHLGEPALWGCPRCGEHVLVYESLPFEHTCCRDILNPHVRPRTFYYYYRLTPATRIHSLVLVGALADDPLLKVSSRSQEGVDVAWERRQENGDLVFYPPPGTNAPDGHVLTYSPWLQTHAALPRREMERRAMAGAHSA